MPPRAAETLLQSKTTRWFVAGLTLVLLAISDLPWQLDDYDQAKQAFTSFEMVKEGHWFYQRTPNEKVATKPPLVGWVSAAVFGLTRSWAMAWRLPSFICALALLALLYCASARSFGRIAGLIAMSAFGLNMLTLRLGTLVRTDMPLALVVFLLGWQIFEKIRSRAAWAQRDRILTFALLTAAMLIKGPIIYAFLLPGMVAFDWHYRKDDSVPGARDGWWPWLWSLGIFLVWVLGGIFFQSGFFHQVVIREFAGRFGETMHRPQTIYFYLPHLLQKFAPWSVLGLVLLFLLRRTAAAHLRDRLRRVTPETFWLIAWSLGGLIVMSLVPSKRVDRIFPIIPPLCLLLATLVARGSAQEKFRAGVLRWSAVALLAGCVASAGYTAFKVSVGLREHSGALVAFGKEVRAEAQRRGWNFAVMGGEDEGLLLYLEQLHFSDEADVVAKWNARQIDGVVAPEEARPILLRDLPGSVPTHLQSWREGERGTPHYIWLTRS